jgi:hypothetical protein
MIELIGKTFVTVCAFLAILALLVSGAYSVIGSNSLGSNHQSAADTARMNNTFSSDQISSITKTYTLLSPVAIPVSSFGIGSYCNPNLNGNMQTDVTPSTFLDNPTNVLAYLWQDTNLDGFHHVSHPVYITFHQEWGGFIGLFISHAEITLDVTTVMNGINTNDGISYTNIQLREGYTILITPDAGTSLQSDWTSHTMFNVSVGQTFTNATALTSGDALQIIGEIMTFTVPNVGSWVNLILAAVLIPTYAILIFFVIRSFIPWLGG